MFAATISSLAFRPPSSAKSMTPMTTNPQISTATTSALPNDPSHSRTAKKRKHGRHSQEVKVSSKRRKATGRPKNNWTCSRLRKLVRLYLLTDLEVGDIVKVLGWKDFHPCSRDVQKKLELLLQPRPYQLRQKKHSSRSRLQVLEECRRLHRSWRESKSHNVEPARQSINKNEIPGDSSISLSPPGDDFTSDWWMCLEQALDQDHGVYSQSLDYMASHTSSPITEDMSTRITSISTISESDFIPGLAVSDFGSAHIQEFNESSGRIRQYEGESHIRGPEISQSDNKLSARDSRPNKVQQVTGGLSVALHQSCKGARQAFRNFSRPFVQSQIPPSLSPAAPTDTYTNTLHSEEPSILVEDYDFIQSHPNRTLNNNTSTGSVCEYSGTEKRLSEDQSDIKIRLSIGGRSSQGSFLSITSLSRRLSSKYSQSDLENVRSVMRLTVPRSSALFKTNERSSTTSSRKGPRAFPRQFESPGRLSTRTQEPNILQPPEPPVLLPGIFHTFCAAQMKKGNLQHCRRDGVCEHHDAYMRRFFLNKPSHAKVTKLWRIKGSIDDVDQFGNTALHVAASLPLPVRYVIKLIEQNADTSLVNLAGQTFLHLLRNPGEADDVCLLLEMLSISGFNFLQQDQNGQSSLHCLLSPPLPRKYQRKIIRRILALGLVKSDLRDNRGCTLFGLMGLGCSQLFGTHPSIYSSLELSSSCNSSLSGISNRSNSLEVVASAAPNLKELDFEEKIHELIHTEEDIQRYYHADLLRTIVRAGENPSAEDHEGRNGLHCLAEVLIDIPQDTTMSISSPTPSSSSYSTVSSSIPTTTKREQYLHNLLAAGVDPNSHDKQGMTPLMAFVTHIRRHRILGKDDDQEEDDATTTRLLTLLLNAKADINRRNRDGETALHLAVVLGRRAATKCLLARGANVHARNAKGQGIVDIGMRAWNEAGRKGKGVDEEKLYARIMLCLCLVVSLGAVSEPSVLQEWTSPTVEGSIRGKAISKKRNGLDKSHKVEEDNGVVVDNCGGLYI